MKLKGLIPAHAGKTCIAGNAVLTVGAHPRSRGENIKAAVSVVVEWGSSPLTRGKLSTQRLDGLLTGLIPAHAGKTPSSASKRWAAPAHPRSRGENGRAPRISAPHTGSSPLTRGKQRVDLGGCVEVRLIPAHAGKTVSGLGARQRGGAHPRSRGENLVATAAVDAVCGSSPLTRGKRDKWAVVEMGGRLIPAHAGKTRCCTLPQYATWAHPRSRGENSKGRVNELVEAGSSPLTRGKPTDRTLPVFAHGLIPAHAGKTLEYRKSSDSQRAHPRSRGENAGAAACTSAMLGSSPLTRGKPVDQQAARRTDGLIPAHAGKTVASARAASAGRAHPRSVVSRIVV